MTYLEPKVLVLKEKADVVVAAGCAPNAVAGFEPNNVLVPGCAAVPKAGVVEPKAILNIKY